MQVRLPVYGVQAQIRRTHGIRVHDKPRLRGEYSAWDLREGSPVNMDMRPTCRLYHMGPVRKRETL